MRLGPSFAIACEGRESGTTREPATGAFLPCRRALGIASKSSSEKSAPRAGADLSNVREGRCYRQRLRKGLAPAD